MPLLFRERRILTLGVFFEDRGLKSLIMSGHYYMSMRVICFMFQDVDFKL